MRLRVSRLAAVAVLMLALSSPAVADGPQLVSQQYAVSSLTVPGVDTGFIVEPGIPVTVTATGCWFVYICVGPDGDPDFDTTRSSYGGFVLPGAPAWGLVGRVGDGPWTHIGSGPTTLSGSGLLVFAVNDDYFDDNIGSLSATVTHNGFSYEFAGFFAPIDNGGVLNVVRAGSTIPVRFSLAGDQGLAILAEGSPSSRPIACNSAAPQDLVEETTSAGSSTLSYDAANDQYRYAWQTSKAWNGTCRELTVQLIDGNSYTALFSFTR
jgi:hypothetical protein